MTPFVMMATTAQLTIAVLLLDVPTSLSNAGMPWSALTTLAIPLMDLAFLLLIAQNV
jgi:hypothetical protein